MNAAGPLQQGIAAARSLFELMDEPAEPNNGSGKAVRVAGKVAYRDVSFSYRGSQARTLRNLSFECRPGTVTAIVGRSGGGKSTLLNLLPRLYEISSGAIEIDGIDVRDLELNSLRNQIAFVSQDTVLFNDTISNNITVGRESPPDEIERAARSARVIDFARHMESGLDTPIGDRGSLLSGGQRQRVAIARALLKDAPILVLDEATASLDAETEDEIQRELETLMRDRTTLVIAHRLRTVERADRILVVDAGEIVETGTHVELLSKNGVYAALHARQFSD